jgi:hypothetical protein
MEDREVPIYVSFPDEIVRWQGEQQASLLTVNGKQQNPSGKKAAKATRAIPAKDSGGGRVGKGASARSRKNSRLPSTMDLLNLALETDTLVGWAHRLGLSSEALRTSRHRGRLAPLIAGALAEALQLDPAKWIVISALESEHKSACRTRMIKYFSALGNA